MLLEKVLLLLLLSAIGSPAPSFSDEISNERVRLCILNCGQCKEMYGDLFLGKACAEACLNDKSIYLGKSRLSIPDCNTPKSVIKYFKPFQIRSDVEG